MQEIQTEATMGMFMDTETTKQPDKQKFIKRLKTGARFEWPYIIILNIDIINKLFWSEYIFLN